MLICISVKLFYTGVNATNLVQVKKLTLSQSFTGLNNPEKELSLYHSDQRCINLFPGFLTPILTQIFFQKLLTNSENHGGKKEKKMVTNIFSFACNFFCPMEDKFYFLRNICHLQMVSI